LKAEKQKGHMIQLSKSKQKGNQILIQIKIKIQIKIYWEKMWKGSQNQNLKEGTKSKVSEQYLRIWRSNWEKKQFSEKVEKKMTRLKNGGRIKKKEHVLLWEEGTHSVIYFLLTNGEFLFLFIENTMESLCELCGAGKLSFVRDKWK